MGTSSAWTPARRAKQAERIRRVKPWEKSTGPRTAEGKARSSRNAFRYGSRPALRAIGRHAQIVERIVRLEIKRTGRKPFNPDGIRAKRYGLTPEEHSELADLKEKQSQTFRAMMNEIEGSYDTDWHDLAFGFKMPMVGK